MTNLQGYIEGVPSSLPPEASALMRPSNSGGLLPVQQGGPDSPRVFESAETNNRYLSAPLTATTSSSPSEEDTSSDPPSPRGGQQPQGPPALMTAHDALHQARRNYSSPRPSSGGCGARRPQHASAGGSAGGAHHPLAYVLPQRPFSAPPIPPAALPLRADGEDDVFSSCAAIAESMKCSSDGETTPCNSSPDGSQRGAGGWSKRSSACGGGGGSHGAAALQDARPSASERLLPAAAAAGSGALRKPPPPSLLQQPPWPRGRGQDASAGSFSGFYPGSWDSMPSAAPTPNSSWLGISQLEEEEQLAAAAAGGGGDHAEGKGWEEEGGENGGPQTPRNRDESSRRGGGGESAFAGYPSGGGGGFGGTADKGQPPAPVPKPADGAAAGVFSPSSPRTPPGAALPPHLRQPQLTPCSAESGGGSSSSVMGSGGEARPPVPPAVGRPPMSNSAFASAFAAKAQSLPAPALHPDRPGTPPPSLPPARVLYAQYSNISINRAPGEERSAGM